MRNCCAFGKLANSAPFFEISRRLCMAGRRGRTENIPFSFPLLIPLPGQLGTIFSSSSSLFPNNNSVKIDPFLLFLWAAAAAAVEVLLRENACRRRGGCFVVCVFCSGGVGGDSRDGGRLQVPPIHPSSSHFFSFSPLPYVRKESTFHFPFFPSSTRRLRLRLMK